MINRRNTTSLSLSPLFFCGSKNTFFFAAAASFFLTTVIYVGESFPAARLFLFLTPAPALQRWLINLNDPTLCSFKDASRMQCRQIEVNSCSPALHLPSAHLDYGPTLQRCANIINPFSCGNDTSNRDQREALSPLGEKCHISVFQGGGGQNQKN